MILGLGVMIILSGVQITGQIISQLSGMSLADVFNPGFDSEVPLLSHLMYLVTLSTFLLIGGHRQLLGALVRPFKPFPLETPDCRAALVICSPRFWVKALHSGSTPPAAPVMVALLLATILLGLISRTIPQINVLVVGFGSTQSLHSGLPQSQWA